MNYATPPPTGRNLHSPNILPTSAPTPQLPMPLLQYMRLIIDPLEKSDLGFKESALAQMCWVRDTLGGMFHVMPTVISTHRSKSVILPVYEIDTDGLRLYLRNNFYNWKLSVISKEPITATFDGLFEAAPPRDPDYHGNHLAPCYFEGFPPELCFGYYEASGKHCWSAELGGKEQVWTTCYLILAALGRCGKYVSKTREEHQAQLARDREVWEHHFALEKRVKAGEPRATGAELWRAFANGCGQGQASGHALMLQGAREVWEKHKIHLGLYSYITAREGYFEGDETNFVRAFAGHTDPGSEAYLATVKAVLFELAAGVPKGQEFVWRAPRI